PFETNCSSPADFVHMAAEPARSLMEQFVEARVRQIVDVARAFFESVLDSVKGCLEVAAVAGKVLGFGIAVIRKLKAEPVSAIAEGPQDVRRILSPYDPNLVVNVRGVGTELEHAVPRSGRNLR